MSTNTEVMQTFSRLKVTVSQDVQPKTEQPSEVGSSTRISRQSTGAHGSTGTPRETTRSLQHAKQGMHQSREPSFPHGLPGPGTSGFGTATESQFCYRFWRGDLSGSPKTDGVSTSRI